MQGSFRTLIRAERAAVAPFVAMSLFFLIGMGGVAFDYAHLAALDTELQQAADHAALAAATQLDRTDDAIAHATAAVSGTAANRLAANVTKFANDGATEGTAVTMNNLTFCSEFDDSEPLDSVACEETTDSSEARFVMVTTSVRTAEYALTPVVGVLSGTLSASAVAGIESNICNVAPVLVCLPNDDLDFPTSADIGRGLLLKPFGGENSWAPGNYGLLDFGLDGPGGNTAVKNALLGNGLNGCSTTDDNSTEPGTKEITDAINTRLDVYVGNNPESCDLSTGAGCPAASARKDMVLRRSSTYTVTGNATQPTEAEVIAAGAAPVCPASPVLSNSVEFQTSEAPVEGLGRDTCHYSETCTGGNFGDASWNRDGYFLSVYGWSPSEWQANTELDANASRFEVYQWELENPSARLATNRHLSIDPTPKETGPPSNRRYEWTINAQCNYGAPVFNGTSYPAQKDRRILPVVAADCSNLTGAGQAYEDYRPLRVFDIFLTEPSATRTYPGPTDNKEIYGEVIGPAETVSGGSGFQYYARNRPYLVR